MFKNQTLCLESRSPNFKETYSFLRPKKLYLPLHSLSRCLPQNDAVTRARPTHKEAHNHHYQISWSNIARHTPAAASHVAADRQCM